MTHPHLHVETDGPVRTLTLTNPDKLNAQVPSLWRALADEAGAITEETRVVVIRAEGRAFSAGLDRGMLSIDGVPGEEHLGTMALAGGSVLADTIGEYQEGFLRWAECPAIVVAQVQGAAIGAGFQLALAADLRVVADDVAFAMRETSLGLVPDLAGTTPLVSLVGPARALEMCVTGRTVGAAEAQALGLANVVAPRDQLDATTTALVSSILQAPAPAVRALKPLLRAASAEVVREQSVRERTAQVDLMTGLVRSLMSAQQ